MKLFETHRPIVEFLNRATDETRIIYNWSKIEEKERRRTIFVRSVPPVLIAVAVMATLFTLMYFSRSHTDRLPKGPLAREDQPMALVLTIPPTAAEQQQVVLSDGSRLTVAPGATLDVIENTDGVFKTALRSGWVRFNVIPNQERSWIIDAGNAAIHVIGTQFTVSRTQQSLAVRVHRGTVHVRPIPFRGAITELSAGESQTWPITKQNQTVMATAASPDDPAAPMTNEKAPTLSMRTSRRVTGSQSPSPPAPSSRLAGMGASKASNDLLDEVDRARRQGRYKRASVLLNKLIKEFPDDPVVGLAVLTLARIHLNRLGHPAAAAEAFRFAANVKTLPASLREQAAARTVEAFHRAGNRALARTMRDRYIRRYPNGEWLQMVERWGAETE